MSNTITIKESIFIAQPIEEVYDFTQDYNRRPLWDVLIKDAAIIEHEPTRKVQMVAKDGANMTVLHTSEEHPYSTQLSIVETDSQMLNSGEYIWTYKALDGGTVWTQENTIHLKDALWAKLMLPVASKYFKDKTIQAMQKAKEMMEG